MSFNNGFKVLTQIFSHAWDCFLGFHHKNYVILSTYCSYLVTQIGEVLEEGRANKIV
jgi:hypothetical protein